MSTKKLRANEFLRQQKRLHTCRRKRLRFSFARNKDGLLLRFCGTKTEKALKYAKNKNFFQKQGQKKTNFAYIYTVRLLHLTHFIEGS